MKHMNSGQKGESDRAESCENHSKVGKLTPDTLRRICTAIDDSVIVFDVGQNGSDPALTHLWNNADALEIGEAPLAEYKDVLARELFGTTSWETHEPHVLNCINNEGVEDYTYEARNGDRVFHAKLTPVTENGSVQQIVALTRDITRLERQDAKYRDLFEASRDAILTLDENGFRDCNDATLDLFGISSREVFVETSPWELSPPTQPDGRDSTKAARQYIERAFETGSASFAWEHERTDGSTFNAEIKLSRFDSNEGPALHAIIRDVTDRKSFETQLSALHGATRSFVQAEARDDLAELSVETAEKLLGFTLPSVWYATDDRLELVANSAEHQALLEEAGDPEPSHPRESNVWEIFEEGETVILSPIPPDDLAADVPLHSAIICPLADHGLLACATRGEVEFSDRQIKLVEVLARNVEVALDEVKARGELQQQQQFTSDLIDAIEDVVYVMDQHGDMVLWNDALERVSGYEGDAIAGMNAADFFTSVDAESVCEAIGEAFEEGRVRFELNLKTASGDTIPYEFIAQTFAAPWGERVMAGIGRDRTVHVEYENRLEEQRDNLKLLNQVVRHDIRNDLMIVNGYAGLLEEHVDGQARDHLETITHKSESAIALTKTARDLSEVILSTGMETREVPVIATLEQQVEEIRSAHPDSVITLSGDLEETTVIADEMLDAVFRNILKNAVQHNDKEIPEVEVTVIRNADTLIVHAADNGPGVADERKDEIFGKGERALDSPGTGLGLYLVRTLIARYGGDVWVEDNDPEGAVFVIELMRPS